MTDALRLFDLAQLAEASYADFTSSDKKQALKDEGFSETQATEFLTHWQVVNQMPDTIHGFSATLFQRVDSDPLTGAQAGDYAFAIRGSTPDNLGIDFQIDASDIFADGIALDQMVDMYNYWQQLTTPVGQSYQRAALLPVNGNIVYPPGSYIVDNPTGTIKTITFADSASAYPAGDSRQYGLGFSVQNGITVAGHSLGGHLTMAFTALFPGLNAEAFGVNGLGFRENSNINNLLTLLGGSAQFNAANIENVYGLAGPEFAAQNTWLLTQPGGYDGIYIEDGIGHVGGHSATQMTDSMAVYNLLIRLGNQSANQSVAATLTKLTPIFDKASNQAATSLEQLVKGLSLTLLGTNPDIITDDREALYAAIKDITDSPTYQSLLGNVTLAAPPTSGSEARTDFSAFLSLFYLTPFTLKTNNAEANNLLLAIHQALGDKWTADYNLNSEDLQNGKANFSDLWLADRAAMLSWVNLANKEDIQTSADQQVANNGLPNALEGATQRYYFQDMTSGTEVYLGTSQDRQKFIFGSIAADTIAGSDFNDHLYGMGGNDTLNGGKGKDWLEGGADDDYIDGGNGDNDFNFGRNATNNNEWRMAA